MFASILRTVVPLIAGILITAALRVGIELPEGAVTEIVTVVVSGAYYWLVRAAERSWPVLGRILLGLGLTGRQPVYVKPGAVVPLHERHL